MIRHLRRQLGTRFVGGFVPTEFARRHYPDCVADVSTNRRDFIDTSGRGGIGVSTHGLYRFVPRAWRSTS